MKILTDGPSMFQSSQASNLHDASPTYVCVVNCFFLRPESHEVFYHSKNRLAWGRTQKLRSTGSSTCGFAYCVIGGEVSALHL